MTEVATGGGAGGGAGGLRVGAGDGDRAQHANGYNKDIVEVNVEMKDEGHSDAAKGDNGGDHHDDDDDEAPLLVDIAALPPPEPPPEATNVEFVQGSVPVTIVTGFLGSGKTTLLNHILTQEHGRKIAVIENEFGDSMEIEELIAKGADGTKLADNLFELKNGCICCTVKDDLVTTLETLLTQRAKFDYVIIETTGLANPGPVASVFWLDDAIGSALRLDGIVTLVDAKHIDLHLNKPLDVPLATPLGAGTTREPRDMKEIHHNGGGGGGGGGRDEGGSSCGGDSALSNDHSSSSPLPPPPSLPPPALRLPYPTPSPLFCSPPPLQRVLPPTPSTPDHHMLLSSPVIRSPPVLHRPRPPPPSLVSPHLPPTPTPPRLSMLTLPASPPSSPDSPVEPMKTHTRPISASIVFETEHEVENEGKEVEVGGQVEVEIDTQKGQAAEQRSGSNQLQQLSPQQQQHGEQQQQQRQSLPLHPTEAAMQIAYADRILLNKADLVSVSQLKVLKEKISGINAVADVRTTVRSVVDVDWILDICCFDADRALAADKALSAAVTAHEGDGSHDHSHDDGGGGCSCVDAEEHRTSGSVSRGVSTGQLCSVHDGAVGTAMAEERNCYVDLYKLERWIGSLVWADGDDGGGGGGGGGRSGVSGAINNSKGHMCNGSIGDVMTGNGTNAGSSSGEMNHDSTISTDVSSVEFQVLQLQLPPRVLDDHVQDGGDDSNKIDMRRQSIPLAPFSIYRMKGILNVEGKEERYVLQGVHDLFDITPSLPWPKPLSALTSTSTSTSTVVDKGCEEGEVEDADVVVVGGVGNKSDERSDHVSDYSESERVSKVVFIGRNLPLKDLQDGFRSCCIKMTS